MTLDELTAALTKGVSADADARTLTELVAAVASNAADKSLLQNFFDRLGKSGAGEANERAVNVLAAGFFGMLPGGASLRPLADDVYRYRVNPFLHRLRLAILANKALDAGRKSNGKAYAFYPEFKTDCPDSIHDRVVAVACAHAGMKPKNDELKVLYSLGGYFDDKVAGNAVNVTQSKGTTCVMTARAVYHAAGAAMIGDRPPPVNTPDGPLVELGAPRLKKQRFFNTKTHKQDVKDVAVETVQRADLVSAEFWKTKHHYDELEQNDPPHLNPGDIYLIRGHGDFKFLLRGGGAEADHVGIVVTKSGMMLDTVDGGGGGGADVDMTKGRKLTYVKDAGWTFERASKCFTAAENLEIDKWVNGLIPETLEALILGDASYKHLKPNYTGTVAALQQALDKGETVKAEQQEKARKSQLETARSLARQLYGAKYGSPKTIQGWWQPELFKSLEYVDRASLRKLVEGRQLAAT